MNSLLELIETELRHKELSFREKPIVIGGMAMEYYGIRQSGDDIDLIVRDDDYQELAYLHPDKRKDIWGDLGVVIDNLEIWRSIALFDYDFYLKDAVEEQVAYIISLERLSFTRALAMNVEKYRNDFNMITQYYLDNHRNEDFLQNALSYFKLYQKTDNGIVWAGQYED